MDWDQIETKWAAMAHRVRGGCASAKADTQKTLMHQVTGASLPAGNIADRQARGSPETLPKTPSE